MKKTDFKGKRVLIFGTGKSGIAAAKLLAGAGADLLIYDGKAELKEEEIREKDPVFSEGEICIGELKPEFLDKAGAAILSPGVPLDCPEALRIKEKQIPILGEIELGYLFGSGRLAAITGTNGKTTTTALTGELLKRHFRDVRVVGNIGIPYTEEAASMTEATVTAAEISSFQLETADTFHPEASAILNITPDHLDRHHTMEAYIKAKERITENQTPSEVLVLNYEDPVLRSFGEGMDRRVVWFSSAQRVENGLFTENGTIYVSRENKTEALIDTKELKIIGRHNWENAMAASAIALSMGVTMEEVREGLKAFSAVPHRIEFVAEIDGVLYYNDSKGTNPDAAIRAITSMDRPTILIGGGYDKGSEYNEWIRECKGRAKKLLLIGQTREKIREACDAEGFSPVEFCETLEEAVKKAAKETNEGEAVLLSPACASWGMFKNYEERGDLFKEYVLALKK